MIESCEHNSDSYEKESDLIKFTEEMESNPLDITVTTHATGLYLENLQKQSNFAPIFPLKLIPISKDRYKKWGFAYAALTVKESNELKRFQQDAALSYTRFQSMSEEQWEAIKEDSIEGLTQYCDELRKTGVSEVEIPKPYKDLIDKYVLEYNTGVIELHEHLRSQKKGCLGAAIFAILLVVSFALLIAL